MTSWSSIGVRLRTVFGARFSKNALSPPASCRLARSPRSAPRSNSGAEAAPARSYTEFVRRGSRNGSVGLATARFRECDNAVLRHGRRWLGGHRARNKRAETVPSAAASSRLRRNANSAAITSRLRPRRRMRPSLVNDECGLPSSISIGAERAPRSSDSPSGHTICQIRAGQETPCEPRTVDPVPPRISISRAFAVGRADQNAGFRPSSASDA